MSALDKRLAGLRAANRPALIGYWVSGYPDLETSKRAIETMVAAGVDVVEVGIPYSDPVMDGPTIQQAAEIALANGARVRDAFQNVQVASAAGAAAVVMSYWNVIEQYGVEKFANDLENADGSGIITPDLTPDESGEWNAAAKAHELNQIFLVAPSSSDARLQMTADAASGFIYATAIMGVTGVRESASNLAPELVERTRRVTDKPIGVGLGVSNAAQAEDVGKYADAVIVGSAFINAFMNAPDAESGLKALADAVADIRSGIDRSRENR